MTNPNWPTKSAGQGGGGILISADNMGLFGMTISFSRCSIFKLFLDGVNNLVLSFKMSYFELTFDGKIESFGTVQKRFEIWPKKFAPPLVFFFFFFCFWGPFCVKV